MIMDSHAHYNNNAYKKPFRYLTYGEDGYSLKEGDREQLFRELQDAEIPYSIEPGVSLQSCGEVLEFAAQYHVVLPVLDGHADSGAPFITIVDNANRPISCIDARFGGQILALGGLRHGDLSINHPVRYVRTLTEWIRR